MDLSIIILNYNTKDLTIDCLNSIIGQYKQELDNSTFEIILVDNASTDDSVLGIDEKYVSGIKTESLKLIESKENLGFSKAQKVINSKEISTIA